jgi:hypothetical protein
VKKHILILYCLLLLSPAVLRSQNAPITTAGRVINATPGAPSVPIHVTVTGFTNIGHFTLTLSFDTTKVHYVSATKNASLTSMSVTYVHPLTGLTDGQLIFVWTGTVGNNLSLADGSSLADLTFAYVNGTGLLSWVYSSGCWYKRYIGTTLVQLNDSPQYLYYLNGGISNRSAPFTYAPVFTNPLPGPLPIPITVNGFTDIGALTLNLEYDPAVINYSGTFTKNAAFGTTFLVGDNAGFGNHRLIVVSWFGSSVSLANGSTLCTLDFSYPSANCSPCALSWFDRGPSCSYSDGNGDVLIDMPQTTYYFDGLVPAGLLPTWTGSVSSAWNDVSNWNACGIPDITRDVVIPNISPNPFPIVTTAASCKSLNIQSGATVSVSPTGSITLGSN